MPNVYCDFIVKSFVDFCSEHELYLDQAHLIKHVYKKLTPLVLHDELPGIAFTVKHILDTITDVKADKNDSHITAEQRKKAKQLAMYTLTTASRILNNSTAIFGSQLAPEEITIDILVNYRDTLESNLNKTKRNLKNILKRIELLIKVNSHLIPADEYNKFARRAYSEIDDLSSFTLKELSMELESGLVGLEEMNVSRMDIEEIAALLEGWNAEVSQILDDPSQRIILTKDSSSNLNMVIDLMHKLQLSNVAELLNTNEDITKHYLSNLVPHQNAIRELIYNLITEKESTDLFVNAVLSLAKKSVTETHDNQQSYANHFEVKVADLSKMEHNLIRAIGFNFYVPTAKQSTGLLRVYLAQMTIAEREEFIRTNNDNVDLKNICDFAKKVNYAVLRKMHDEPSDINDQTPKTELETKCDECKSIVDAAAVGDEDEALIKCALNMEIFMQAQDKLKQIREQDSTIHTQPDWL